jgi:hypothetical protein
VVAMATSAINFYRDRRRTTLHRVVSPPISISTFPGKRVEPMRACTMATVLKRYSGVPWHFFNKNTASTLLLSKY